MQLIHRVCEPQKEEKCFRFLVLANCFTEQNTLASCNCVRIFQLDKIYNNTINRNWWNVLVLLLNKAKPLKKTYQIIISSWWIIIIVHYYYLFLPHFCSPLFCFWRWVSICCQGRSQDHGLKWSTNLILQRIHDYRHVSPCLTKSKFLLSPFYLLSLVSFLYYFTS